MDQPNNIKVNAPDGADDQAIELVELREFAVSIVNPAGQVVLAGEKITVPAGHKVVVTARRLPQMVEVAEAAGDDAETMLALQLVQQRFASTVEIRGRVLFARQDQRVAVIAFAQRLLDALEAPAG